MYLVTYRELSKVMEGQAVVRIEAEIDADEMSVEDGALILYKEGQAVLVLPSTFWFQARKAESALL